MEIWFRGIEKREQRFGGDWTPDFAQGGYGGGANTGIERVGRGRSDGRERVTVAEVRGGGDGFEAEVGVFGVGNERGDIGEDFLRF